MSSYCQLRTAWLSLLGVAAIAGTIGGCGHAAGVPSAARDQPAEAAGAHVPWNSPFLHGWSSGNGPKQPPVTVASVAAARRRLAGRKLPFQIRALPGLGQPFRVLTDPWPGTPSVHQAAVALQYHTPHGLADVVETLYPGTSEKEFERESRSYIDVTPPPGTIVTRTGQALIVYVDGHFGFMTLGANGSGITLSWRQGREGYLVEGPSLGKTYCLQLATELASQ